MKLYKLTTKDFKTRAGQANETLWGEGVTHRASGKGPLCSAGWLHAYTHPLLAMLLNPVHADILDPILWECEGEIGAADHGLKVGCTELTTLRVIPLPEISDVQRARFAILCALEVCRAPDFVAWAERWLSEEDMTARGAWTESTWLWATEAATAPIALWAAKAAAAAMAAAAVAATAAAWAASYAALYATESTEASSEIDFIALAERAMGAE